MCYITEERGTRFLVYTESTPLNVKGWKICDADTPQTLPMLENPCWICFHGCVQTRCGFSVFICINHTGRMTQHSFNLMNPIVERPMHISKFESERKFPCFRLVAVEGIFAVGLMK